MLNINKTLIFPKLVCRFNAIPIKSIITGFFVFVFFKEVDRLVLNLFGDVGPRIAK